MHIATTNANAMDNAPKTFAVSGCRWKCSVCSKAYQTQPALSQHMRCVHGPGKICPYCSKRSSSGAVLRKHIAAIHAKASKNAQMSFEKVRKLVPILRAAGSPAARKKLSKVATPSHLGSDLQQQPSSHRNAKNRNMQFAAEGRNLRFCLKIKATEIYEKYAKFGIPHDPEVLSVLGMLQ